MTRHMAGISTRQIMYVCTQRRAAFTQPLLPLKALRVIYYDCVSGALVIRHAKRMYPILIKVQSDANYAV